MVCKRYAYVILYVVKVYLLVDVNDFPKLLYDIKYSGTHVTSCVCITRITGSLWFQN